MKAGTAADRDDLVVDIELEPVVFEDAVEHEAIAALQRVHRHDLAANVGEAFDLGPRDDVIAA